MKAQLVSVVCLLVVAGCASQSASVVGKWKIDTNTVTGAGNTANDPSSQASKAIIEGFAKTMTFEFKADKTFNFTMMMLPVAGTYVQDGHQIKLHLTSMMGMDPSKMSGGNTNNQDGMATLSDDGSKLTIDGTPGQSKSKDPLILIRDTGK